MTGIDVRCEPAGDGWSCRVTVREGASSTSHDVRVRREDLERFADGGVAQVNGDAAGQLVTADEVDVVGLGQCGDDGLEVGGFHRDGDSLGADYSDDGRQRGQGRPARLYTHERRPARASSGVVVPRKSPPTAASRGAGTRSPPAAVSRLPTRNGRRPAAVR